METLATTRRRTLMALSWEIQKKKKVSCSKSLESAWAITLNEDITVYYLVKRHSPQRLTAKPPQTASLSLFKHS